MWTRKHHFALLWDSCNRSLKTEVHNDAHMVCIFGCAWKFWLCGRSLLWRGGATGCSKGNVQVRTWQKTSCFTYRADVWLVLFFFGSCFSKNWCSSSVSYVAAQACGGAWCLQLGLTKHSWMSHQFDLFSFFFQMLLLQTSIDLQNIDAYPCSWALWCFMPTTSDNVTTWQLFHKCSLHLFTARRCESVAAAR